MAPTRSRNKSNKQQLEESREKLRSALGFVERVQTVFRTDEEILRAAFEVAEDVAAFAVKYFSHFMRDQATGEAISPAEFHKELYQMLLNEKLAAIAAPREHAKSTIVSVIFVLYCICYKLRRFIVLISDTQDQAALQMAAVKAELEFNDKLREDFGDLAGKDAWNVNDIRTVTEISVAARGAGQSLRGLRYRGWRPDLVICDDLENDEAVANPERREALLRWFTGTVMNLGKSCQIFVIGTILHYDSLLSALLDENRFKRFAKRRYEAVDQEFRPESVLWPAKWDVQSLKDKAEDIGDVMFNQEFRNLPISESTQVFKEAPIVQHAFTRDELRRREEAGEQFVTISYNDPAISQREKADYFASVTIKVDAKGFILVTRAEQDRMPFTKQLQFMVDRYDMEKPIVVGVEEIAYQAALKQELERIGRETGRYIPVIGVKNLTDKFLRISTLGPLVENGTIRFCLDGTQKTLISQLLFLGKIKDDLADALQGAVGLARNYTFKPAFATSDVQVGARDGEQLRAGERMNEVGKRGRSRADMLLQSDRRSLWR
jgi:predicted phage terminase large subunit-like protein